jgi:tetratricopeptide (TPR) repeat protein
MGCVHEPYLGGTPDMGVFISRLLFHNFTFGEAAYASQNVLSWMTTVVGDPLYRPFAKPPQQLHQELEAKRSRLIEWSHLRVVNLNRAHGAPINDQVNYLEEIPTTKVSAVLSEKLGDLCAAQGKPSSAVHAYDRALKLDPSPQQRIRLRLTLGEKLLALNREGEAYANYQKFVEECPDYVDKVAIYRKLVSLAQKLGKKEDAARYEDRIKLLTAPAK